MSLLKRFTNLFRREIISQPEPVEEGPQMYDAIGYKISSEEKRMLLERVRKWSKDPTLKVHKMITVVARSKNGLSRQLLVQEVSRVTKSKNPYGAVSSLLTSKGNNYGRVFIDVDGIISIHPEMIDEVSRSTWRV